LGRLYGGRSRGAARRRAVSAWRKARKERAGDLALADGRELDDLAERDRDAYLERAGFEPLALHEARQTSASLMIAPGVNAKALSTFMRHSSITITLAATDTCSPATRPRLRIFSMRTSNERRRGRGGVADSHG